MSDESYPIFVVDSWGMTGVMVAHDFARDHFAERHTVDCFYTDTSTFRLVDGTATYRVVEQAAVPGVSRATFGVYRMAKEGD